jgi:hypothetical protein
MPPRLPPALAALFLAAILLAVALLSGCTGQPVPGTTETPTVSPIALPPPPPTETTSEPATPAPEPYPGALSIGTPYTYGREDISMEVTVYRVKAMDEYDWWSPKWGRYWNTTPKKGNHFIFALVRLIDRGTARALMPMTHTFVLRSNGGAYIETTDRDNSLWVKDINVKQYQYYYEDTGGWIDPGESNKIEGFVLYEVPTDVTPQNSYISVIFTGKADAVWKLG